MHMPTKPSITDPRVVRTRQLIRDAFIDLLQEIELEKITVNRIAERATINRVTFYLHYKDIPDLMEKMADEMVHNLRMILQIEESPPQLRSSWEKLVELLEHIAEHANFYKVVLASKRVPAFTERLQKLLSDVITSRLEQRKVFMPSSAVSVPMDIAIWHGSSAVIGTIVCWLRNDMPYTPQYLAKQLSLLTPYSEHADLSGSTKNSPTLNP
ncbi:TetR/AcrR family transcriptional regulator [Paenibacillus sp. MMS18-CY102]|uniref:TetR/AcrR family transcriptional regulator n=1 Tax=Paenibacillus sp. MMS18-CY102 TaxID=2682849 RepID=UPI00136543C3|nr:TetR/AcrR family transcriptional regulator [Paenibacillus sp. MMS18-CY102]MWC30720.1 TetR/AcrR family transcriptional regulator [Paenibacillus sp. MMS18-CY102]